MQRVPRTKCQRRNESCRQTPGDLQRVSLIFSGKLIGTSLWENYLRSGKEPSGKMKGNRIVSIPTSHGTGDIMGALRRIVRKVSVLANN